MLSNLIKFYKIIIEIVHPKRSLTAWWAVCFRSSRIGSRPWTRIRIQRRFVTRSTTANRQTMAITSRSTQTADWCVRSDPFDAPMSVTLTWSSGRKSWRMQSVSPRQRSTLSFRPWTSTSHESKPSRSKVWSRRTRRSAPSSLRCDVADSRSNSPSSTTTSYVPHFHFSLFSQITGEGQSRDQRRSRTTVTFQE